MQIKLISILLVISGVVMAAESSIDNASPPKTIATTPNSLNINNQALSQADSDYNQLNALKRQAQIKEAQDKLNPPKPAIVSTSSGGNGNVSGISETTATSIVIDHSGTAFATLQFIDGSTLTVERGSVIGKYMVTDIDMKGVKIATCNKGKCGKTILIKRAYAVTPYKQGGNSLVSPSQSTQMFSAPAKDNSVPPITSM